MATARVGDTGVGEKTIQAIEANRGRVPEAWIIESIAAALDIAPEDFYEYPIAVARREGRRPREKQPDGPQHTARMPEIRRRAASTRGSRRASA